jgi:hypothetical protein
MGWYVFQCSKKGFQYTLLREDFMLLFNVVCCTVVLGPVVSLVGWSRAPEISKLILGFAASEPMELHVHSFSAPGLNVVVYNTMGFCVVDLHWGGWLFVVHFLICLLLGNSLTCINAYGS